MQGRNILDGVVILHEALHELNTKKLIGVILKKHKTRSSGLFFNKLPE
jgi:hypothetical protein